MQPVRHVPAPRDRRLGAVRLGGAAVLHADHHLRLCAVLRVARSRPIRSRGRRCGALRRPRAGPVVAALLAGARRDRGCGRAAQAVDRGVRRAASSSDRACCGSAGRAMPSVIPLVLCAYAIGVIGVEFAAVFNNAMMPSLVPPERHRPAVRHRLGGRLCRRAVQPRSSCSASSPPIRRPARRCSASRRCSGSIRRSREGDRAVGPLTALWFVVFVLPLFLFTPDHAARHAAARSRAARRSRARRHAAPPAAAPECRGRSCWPT